jgi:hypothetical protein
MSNGKIVSNDAGERLEGCLCEYIREDLRDRLERRIERDGGGAPGTNVNFANIIINVNKALEKYLGVQQTSPVRVKKSGARLVR